MSTVPMPIIAPPDRARSPAALNCHAPGMVRISRYERIIRVSHTAVDGRTRNCAATPAHVRDRVPSLIKSPGRGSPDYSGASEYIPATEGPDDRGTDTGPCRHPFRRGLRRRHAVDRRPLHG